ncbi:hypothetical protein C8Q73DRAFT_694267 [Cubamyces lactineus]|nr:hypothetical protein C8Q73DRAFT_694267 [Cubamyces lactineus]
MGTSRSTLPVHITSNDDHPATATSSQTPYMNTDANANRTSRVFRALHPINPFAMSPESDDGVPDRLWFSQDFMLGAGMVIIQPTTGKVVLLREPVGPDPKNPTKTLYYWFLPKGRKDRGESLEQAALREAYEESGLRVTFLPLLIPNHAPLPPKPDADYNLPCTEPICINLHKWAGGRRGSHDYGGEYLTHWYVGQIPDNPCFEPGTRMEDEVNYETYLVSFDMALRLLGWNSTLSRIVRKAYALWEDTRDSLGGHEWQEYLAQIGKDLASLDLGPALEPILASKERQARARASVASSSSSRRRNSAKAAQQ